MSVDPEPGDRVVWTGDGWTPRESLGTVVAVEGSTVTVDRDGTPYEYAAPADGLRVIGCEHCEQTGITADRREGSLYRSPCARCALELKDGWYWSNADTYHLRSEH